MLDPQSNERDSASLRRSVRRWAPVFGASAFLASPLLLHAWRNVGAHPFDLLFAFNLATTVLWLVLLHAVVRRPLVLHLWILPLYLTAAIDLFLVMTFRARLASGYVYIALTDYADTGELLSAYALPLVAVASVLAAVYGICLYGMRNLTKPRSVRWTAAAVAGLFCVYGAAVARDLKDGHGGQRSVLDVAGKEFSSPVGVLFQASLALGLQHQTAHLREERAKSSFSAVKEPSAETELYVLVIGESARPQDWSLFGYSRDTTPGLEKTPGVVPLPDMLTTAPHTSFAVPSLVSLQPIENWSSIVATKSIVEAFNETGFKTYWLSAQAADTWAGLIPEIAAEAGRRRYFDSGYDGALLDAFRDILADSKPGDKLFIVMHTKGSHFDYARRYPPEFARFASSAPTRRQRLVDEYDNSIVYTDWFLSTAIAMVARQRARSVLFYASDHGENLLDDERQLLGHALGTRYDLATAALVWVSPEMARERPDQIRSLHANSSAALSLANLSHSILDVAGIRANGLDRRKSIFSAEFVPMRRSYIVRGELRAERERDSEHSALSK